MWHISSTRSSVDGHLGYSHALTIVNGAAMDIGVHASFQIIVFCLECFLKFRHSVMAVIISSAVNHHGAMCLIMCYQCDPTEDGAGSRQSAPLCCGFHVANLKQK